MNTDKPLPLPLPVDINDINNLNDLVNGFVNVELLKFKFKFLTRNTNTNKPLPVNITKI